MSDESWRGQVGRLDEEEISTFLAEAHLARLACLDDEGWPYVVPCWHEWDGSSFWVIPRKMAYDNQRLFHRDFFRTARSVVRPFGSKQGPDSDEGAREPWESDQETPFAEREGQADVGGVYYHPAPRPPPPKLYRGG
jgi:hypothetical protein